MANRDGSKSGGRQKGTPNKVTASVREAFQEAFNTLQSHPKAKLVSWAKSNPTEFYKLASKLIPIATEVSGRDGKPIEMNDHQAAAKLSAIFNSARARKEEGEKQDE